MGTLEDSIRTAAVNALVTASVAGGRVYSARALPLADDGLTFPLVCVSTVGTNAQKSRQPNGHRGTVELACMAFSRLTDASDEGDEVSFGPESDIESALGTIEQQIRSALLAHPASWLPAGCRGVEGFDSRTNPARAGASALVRERALRIKIESEFLFEYDNSGADDLDRIDVAYHMHDGVTDPPTLPDLSDQIEVGE